MEGQQQSSIVAEAFADQVVFITGFTGFMGKVLVEKLLRSCPRVKRIYVLVRPKRGKEMLERIKEIWDLALFDTVRSSTPDCFEKVVPVAGDILQANLGLSPADREALVGTVTSVFNVAASIRFDLPLKEAVEVNVLPVRKLIRLCSAMQQLTAFVHVSTGFVKLDREVVEERVYSDWSNPGDFADEIMSMSNSGLLSQSIEAQIIHPQPNTYIFTKNLAEQLLAQEGQNLPVAVYRPTIVTAAAYEPLTGWPGSSLFGMNGVVLACAKGLLRVWYGDPEAGPNMMPVDISINGMILTAYQVGVDTRRQMSQRLVVRCPRGSGLRGQGEGSLLVVNNANNDSLTWDEYQKPLREASAEAPIAPLWCDPIPHVWLSPRRWLVKLCVFVAHTLPAWIVDFCMWAKGDHRRMAHVYGKLHHMMFDDFAYFSQRRWRWETSSLARMREGLGDWDKREFDCDPSRLNQREYVKTYHAGLKKFMSSRLNAS